MSKTSENQILDFIKLHQKQIDEMNDINIYKNPNARISKLFDEKVILINSYLKKKNISLFCELIIVFPLKYLFLVNFVVLANLINGWNHIKLRNNIEKFKLLDKANNVVIAHATVRNFALLKKDNSNTGIEKDSIGKNLRVYIDHTGGLNLFRKKIGDVSKNFVILPKTMGLKDMKEFLKETTKLYIRWNRINKNRPDSNLMIKQIQNFLISGQLSIQTFSNFRLSKQIEFISREIESRNVYFPMEGHAIEEYLKFLFAEKFAKNRLVFYQTSPFSKDQPGMVNLMNEIEGSVVNFIQVNDRISKKYIQDLNPSLIVQLAKKHNAVHMCNSQKK